MRTGSLLRWLADRGRDLSRELGDAAASLWRPPELEDPGHETVGGAIERPWLVEPWRVAPVRGTFHSAAIAHARLRGAEVARLTLGDDVWNRLRSQGFLDLRSTHVHGLTYRLRVGRRVQLIWDSPESARRMRWPYRGYLCINPTYPLPAIEFTAHLYLYLRDREDLVIRVAAPQAADDVIRHVF